MFRYMVDAADHEKLEASRNELHGLLEKPQLAGIPVSFKCYLGQSTSKDNITQWYSIGKAQNKALSMIVTSLSE